MKKARQMLFFLLLITSLLASACATTAVTNAWRDPTYQGPIKKVLVIGVSQKKAVQRFFEDEFVRQLRAAGTDAIAGYTILPYEEDINKDFIAAKAKESGADTVLVTRPLGRTTERTYVPGQVYAVPAPYYRWGSYYGQAYSPGYVVEDEYVYVETNLFDLQSEKLIWSAQSETLLSAGNRGLIESFIKTIIAQLSSDKVIK